MSRSVSRASDRSAYSRAGTLSESSRADAWVPTQDWVASWKSKLPLQGRTLFNAVVSFKSVT